MKHLTERECEKFLEIYHYKDLTKIKKMSAIQFSKYIDFLKNYKVTKGNWKKNKLHTDEEIVKGLISIYRS